MASGDVRQVRQLMQDVRQGRLSRRDFMKRAAALGFSASAVGAFLAACGQAAPAPTAGTGGGAGAGVTTAAATTAAGSAAAAGPGGMIKIYSSFPVNSSSKSQIDSVINSIKMALEENGNKAGNFTLVYESLDDGSPAKGGEWDAGVEAANANRAVADPDAMIYLGTFNSGAAKVSIPITNRANLAMISPANTYTGLTKKVEGAVEPNEPEVYYPTSTRTYSRVIPTDDLQGAVGAAYAKEIGAKKVYVLDDTELYGHGLAVVFAEEAKANGLEVVGPEGVDKSATDYRSLGQKIKTANADMVYFGGITGNNAGKLWKDLRAVLGKDFKMMGPDGIYEDGWLDAAGDAAEGSYVTFGGLPPEKLTGKGAEWYKKYKEKYKIEPQGYAAYGYEAASVAIDAIKRAGKKDRAAIREALLATKNWDGVLGQWSFLPTGDTTLTSMSINQVKNGKFEFVKTVQPLKKP